jgi:hypothetical protein
VTEPDPIAALAAQLERPVTMSAQASPSRRCPKCGEIKPLTVDHWHKNRRNADGFDSWCKTCTRARRSDRCKTSRPTARVNNGMCLCRECGEWKPLTPEFWYADKRNSCGYRVARCIQCEREYHARCRRHNLVLYMLANARRRAKKFGVPFSLAPDDIIIPEVCPVLGMSLAVNSGKLGPCSPSLDRIKPELGYVPGNIQVLSARANVMKNDATPEQLLAFADWAYKTYGQVDRDESAT